MTVLAELGESRILESHKDGQGNCPACQNPITSLDIKARRVLPSRIENSNLKYLWAVESESTFIYLCKKCTQPTSEIEEKLDFDDGFGTWAI